MNIFALDYNPEIAARDLCDKHVPKMIVESCQLLSTAHRLIDGEQYADKTAKGHNIKRWLLPDAKAEALVYKASFVNHPCAIWVRHNIAHYTWLARHALEMCKEFEARFGKPHKCLPLVQWFRANAPARIAIVTVMEIQEFALAMPDEFKEADSVMSYRNYYVHAKSRFAKWRNPVDRLPFWYYSMCKERSIPILDDSPALDERFGAWKAVIGFNKP